MINTVRRDILSSVIKYLRRENFVIVTWYWDIIYNIIIYVILIISSDDYIHISRICRGILSPGSLKFPFGGLWIISWLNLEYFLIVNQTLISKQPLKPGYSSCNKWCFFQQRVDINDDPGLRYSWAELGLSHSNALL